MKNLLNRLTAVTSVCVLALCGTAVSVSAEDVVVEDITITFDCSEDGITISDADKALIAPVKTAPKSSIVIPQAFPKKDGYYFSGWTYDGIHAFTYNDIFRSPDGKDVTLKPVWVVKDAEEMYTLSYQVDQNGEIIDTSEDLPDREYTAGNIITIPLQSYTYGDFVQLGWIFEDTEMIGNEKFIMPDHDVTLTPNWKKRYKITYTVGDVDRVVGANFMEYVQPESVATDLQANNRFSRNGFTISGWLCDDDNKVYPPSYSGYVMPSHDVTFTAVWQAKEYTVVFRQDKNASNNLKVKGLTDTEIATPEATITQNGKYLAGWKDEDGTVYPVGSPYMIKGAIAGKGITLEAVWEDGEPPATTTTQSSAKPAETTTTTSAETTTTSTTETTITTSESTTTTATSDLLGTETVWGDANTDGKVNISDAVLIMQSISNPSEYKLSEQGKINADVVGHDDVTNSDALAIQMVEAKLINLSDLPLDKIPDIK
ncbi:MAG: InlB B-repeat-containing protein [Ruminococcus sp.]|nr:InlB B-repeat-containing protein [Ruminococcus sp.]